MSTSFASGIHHVTLITRRVQANVDFYVGFLGLRLIKQTGGFEDSQQLHLFYGDRIGSPGSLVTFLVWEDGAPGRVGNGQVSEVTFAVPSQSIGHWMTKALSAGVKVEGPMREFGETVLRLKDPDGIIVKLVGSVSDEVARSSTLWGDASTAIRRLRGITILSDQAVETIAFVQRFGYRQAAEEGAMTRLQSETDIVDIRNAAGYVPGIPGTGTADHVAFRAKDSEAVARFRDELTETDAEAVNFHNRKYFISLYVREPAGTLIEFASDDPGFLVDEDEGHLGEKLFVPSGDPAAVARHRVLLPQFALPGQPRLPHRDLPFVHRIWMPEQHDGSTLILLHGSGGTEMDLLPLAHAAAPNAMLIGLRGRATEEGSPRWFRRFADGGFDEKDIGAEAEAFEAFMQEASRGYGLEPVSTVFIGYSNGANFLSAVMMLRPGLVKRAALLRPIPVIDPWPEGDLTGTDSLMVAGRKDPFRDRTRDLHDLLSKRGATAEWHETDGTHDLDEKDSGVIRPWLIGH